MPGENALRWNGRGGHYEVYYVTLTDPGTGIGVWIRYTMLAPLSGPGSCSLWFLAMDPLEGVTARKATYPLSELTAENDPFGLRIAGATLDDGGCEGSFEDVSWALLHAPGRAYRHVTRLLEPVASTILVLPHGDVELSGSVEFAGRTLEFSGARGAQAHLWGSKHAAAWAWARCGEFHDKSGTPVADTFVDGVSVRLRRFGRELGPVTPVVGRIDGEDFMSTAPAKVLSNRSSFSLTQWRFEAVDGSRKLVVEVDAEASTLAGVTYEDPDGERAHCYNTEIGSMRLHVYRRDGRRPGWRYERTLLGDGRAHFEYAQRAPIPDVELLV